MNRAHHYFKVAGLVSMFAFAQSAAGATCTSKATGNWGQSTTWNCTGGVKSPGAGDDVIIISPHVVTLTANSSATNLTIDAGATLIDAGNDLTVSGSVVINGTYDGSGNNGNLIMTGNGQTLSGTGTVIDIGRIQIDANITIPATSNLNLTLQSEIRVGNNNPATLTINGTITGTGQTVGNRLIRVDNNNASNVIINGTINAPNSYVQIQSGNKVTNTVTNNGTVTLQYLDGNNNANSTWTQGANSSLTLSKTAQAWAGTFNASATGNTVTYNSPAMPLTPSGNTYYNLGGTGVTCPVAFTVLGATPCPAGAGFVVGSPTSCTNVAGVGTIAWATPANATASDNKRATAASVPVGATTNYLNCTGFNLAVPSGASITGITVNVERMTSAGTITDAFVYLIKAGTVSTAFNGATATAYRTRDRIEAHGGAASLWGTTWTAADVTATNFGVAFAAMNAGPASRTVPTISVDHIQVRVDYAAAVTPSDFNVYDTATAPAASIDGKIHTKIAGQAFTLDIAALNAAKTGLLTTTTATVKVELLDSSDNTGALDANGCRPTWSVIQTLSNQTFGAGDAAITGSLGRHRVTPNITVNNAYKDVRVRVSSPATGTATQIACSTDNFAIRPASLTVNSVQDLDWASAFVGTGTARNLTNTGATGGVVHKAGQPFTISATAYNAAATPAVTGTYNGSPVAMVATVLPTGGVDGVLTPGTWSATGGTVATTTAAYDEAGVFDMTLEDRDFAAVDSADGTAADCTGLYVCSAAVSVGRFVPDHFELLDASASDPLVDPALDTWLPLPAPRFLTFGKTDAACSAVASGSKRSFTYLGQPFGYVDVPQATIKAMDANGNVIQNYLGPLWKLAASGVTQSYGAATGSLVTSLALQTPTLSQNTLYTNGSGSVIAGTVSVNGADKLAFARGASPVAPFTADISLMVGVTDGNESAVPGNGAITGAVTFGSIAFDSGAQMIYGRLKLSNAYGSELLDLPMPLVTQYFLNGEFVGATDNCTTVAAPAAGAGLAGITTTATVHSPFIGGNGGLKLSKPNVKGNVDVTVTAPAYLQYDWNTASPGLENPFARATFGVYKGNQNFIYRREAY